MAKTGTSWKCMFEMSIRKSSWQRTNTKRVPNVFFSLKNKRINKQKWFSRNDFVQLLLSGVGRCHLLFLADIANPIIRRRFPFLLLHELQVVPAPPLIRSTRSPRNSWTTKTEHETMPGATEAGARTTWQMVHTFVACCCATTQAIYEKYIFFSPRKERKGKESGLLFLRVTIVKMRIDDNKKLWYTNTYGVYNILFFSVVLFFCKKTQML